MKSCLMPVACFMLLVPVARAESPAWTLTWTNDANTAGYITQGDWDFPVQTTTDKRSASDNPTGLALLKWSQKGTGDLDLRGQIGDGTWKIIKTVDGPLSGLSGGITVYMPTTLRCMDRNCFGSSTVNIVIDAPDFDCVSVSSSGSRNDGNAGFPGRAFYKTQGTLKLKAPKFKKLDAAAMGWNWETGILRVETDLNDWDLSGATTVDGSANGEDTVFAAKKCVGTLNLPSLENAPKLAFYAMVNVTNIHLGANGSLTNISTYAVSNCAHLTTLALGGVKDGFTVQPHAVETPALMDVIFLTTPPKFTSNETSFGTDATPALQMCFQIPERTQPGWWIDWEDITLAVRPATDEEKAAFLARYGEDRLEDLIGIVPGAVFRTANEQFLAYSRSGLVRHTLSVSLLDPAWTEDSVEILTPPGEDGRYAHGAVVEIKASSTAGSFGKWRGGVPLAQERDATLLLRMDRNYAIRADIFHDWTFHPDPETSGIGTISNRLWMLNVTVANAASRKLNIGVGANSGSAYTTLMGSTVLDMNGRIRDAAGAAYALIGVQVQGSLSSENTAYASKSPEIMVFPETFEGSAFYSIRMRTQWDRSYKAVYVECPNVTGTLCSDFLAPIKGLLSLRIPQITTMNAAYTGTYSADSDAGAWDLRSVTSMAGFSDGSTSYKGVFCGRDASFPRHQVGDVDLPMLGVVANSAFYKADGLTSITLSTNAAVTAILADAFYGCTALCRLTIRMDPAITVDASACVNTPNLRDIRIVSAPPTDLGAVDALLGGVTESIAESARPAVLNVPVSRGWKSGCAGRLVEPTEEELAKYTLYNVRLLGVWKTGDGVRKAFVVDRSRGRDVPGLILIVR